MSWIDNLFQNLQLRQNEETRRGSADTSSPRSERPAIPPSSLPLSATEVTRNQVSMNPGDIPGDALGRMHPITPPPGELESIFDMGISLFLFTFPVKAMF